MADNSITIDAILDAYIDDAKNFRAIADPQSLVSHAKCVRVHWGALSYKEFCDGRNPRARKYAQHRRAIDGVSDSTINREIRNLQAALNFAEREELIAHAVKVLRPPAGAPRERLLSCDGPDGGELKRLMAALSDPRTPAHTRLFTMLSLLAAQRKTANLQLTFDEVDFDAGVIWYARTAKIVTKKKRQNQPMHPALRALLLEAKALARPGCNHVIQFRGRPIKDIRASYKALLKRAGISEFTVHDLRRTAATHVAAALGNNIEAAANLMGNSRAQAARTYVHLAPSANLEAIGAMDAILTAAAR